jgi:cytochrome c-type biogenesis protein CcmE
MKPRHKRIALIVGGLASLAIAAGLALNALDSNIALYVTPSEIAAGKAPQGKAFRIGGMVKAGSVKRQDMIVNFIVTDTVKDIPVVYTGILPDLFRDGKGAVVQGKLGGDGVFVATEVLAKHDENYMPPEAQHAVEQAQRAQRTLK